MKLRIQVPVCVTAIIGVVTMAGPAQASGPCERLAQLGGEGSDPTTCNIVFDPVCALADKFFGGCTT